MIVDAHYHLEPRMESVDKLLEQMDLHGIDHVALMATLQDPVEVQGMTRKFAAIVRKMLASRWPGMGLLLYRTTVTAEGQLSVLGRTYAIYEAPDNGEVARATQSHPDKFYGWIFVNPSVGDPLAELERWAGQPGWIGVKTHPFWHRYPVAMLDDVAAYCDDKNWPLLMHLGGDQERGDYRYLPERHRNLKVIYAHAGVPFYEEVWDCAKSSGNVFVDLSSPIYVGDQVRLGAVKALGAEKCLHGTDGPYGDAEQGMMLQRVLRLPLSDAEKERILGGTFAELINA
jgi:predicted TIM-barrel fold metal-dependent hydrolase